MFGSNSRIKQGEDLFIANLGDSRAVLGTTIENGIEAIQLTTDLKPALPSKKFIKFFFHFFSRV